MPNIELRKCPFCGWKAELKHTRYINGQCSYVQCKKCGCCTKEFSASVEYCADDSAKSAWNRRNNDAAEKP